MDLEDPVHHAHKATRRGYAYMIENMKTSHWDERSVWTAHRYASGDPSDRGMSHIPTLKLTTSAAISQITKMNKEKSKLLHMTFFPEHAQSDQP